jgi:hypothetical protein
MDGYIPMLMRRCRYGVTRVVSEFGGQGSELESDLAEEGAGGVKDQKLDNDAVFSHSVVVVTVGRRRGRSLGRIGARESELELGLGGGAGGREKNRKKTTHNAAFSHGVVVVTMGRGRGGSLGQIGARGSELELGEGRGGEVGRRTIKTDNDTVFSHGAVVVSMG